MAGAGDRAKELACLGVGRYRASRCARMHRYAAKRAMDGGVCYAPDERSEVWFDATVVVSAAERQTWLCLLLGQARSSADMQGRAKWAWLEDRRSSSQLRAGQAMVRVGHEVMRVRRPSKAVPFGLPIRSTLARLVLCGEEREERCLGMATSDSRCRSWINPYPWQTSHRPRPQCILVLLLLASAFFTHAQSYCTSPSNWVPSA